MASRFLARGVCGRRAVKLRVHLVRINGTANLWMWRTPPTTHPVVLYYRELCIQPPTDNKSVLNCLGLRETLNLRGCSFSYVTLVGPVGGLYYNSVVGHGQFWVSFVGKMCLRKIAQSCIIFEINEMQSSVRCTTTCACVCIHQSSKVRRRTDVMCLGGKSYVQLPNNYLDD